MHRHSLIPTVLLVSVITAACQSKEEPVVMGTSTIQTATMETGTITEIPPVAGSTVESPTVVTSTVVTTTTEVPASQDAPATRPVTSTPPPAVATNPAPVTAPQVASATPPPAAPAATAAPTVAAKKLPKTHTVDHEGVKHAPGSDTAVKSCGACHGKDLRGGKMAPSSCFDCHEKVWK